MRPCHIVWCLLIVLLTACAPGLYQYHSVEPEETHDSYRVIPLYVSKDFTHEQQVTIAKAIDEWNFVLNGSLRLEVKDWALDEESDKGKDIWRAINKTHQGIAIVSWLESDPRLEEMKQDGIIAFVNIIGTANVLVVIRDRLGSWDFKTIMLHELGHALGASHVNAKSLMYPYVGDMQVHCVDRITAAQISGYQHVPLKNINYCTTRDFE